MLGISSSTSDCALYIRDKVVKGAKKVDLNNVLALSGPAACVRGQHIFNFVCCSFGKSKKRKKKQSSQEFNCSKEHCSTKGTIFISIADIYTRKL